MSIQDSIRVTLAYHVRTKHHLDRFAASLGYLDWATQPDPFRTFAGADRIALPLMADGPAPSYGDLYVPGRIRSRPVELKSVAFLFELALGLSAWKEYGETRWALRSNPSSGNLHPTEGYAILPKMPGLDIGGVYHYLSRDHCLERRAVVEDWSFMPESSCLVGLSSIHWREAWKYGERAFRYCQHDMGHAIAAVRYAAAVLGWSALLLGDVSDPAVGSALGLLRPEGLHATEDAEPEHPGALLCVGPATGSPDVDVTRLEKVLAEGNWMGQANRASSDHVDWPAIDAVAEATWRDVDDARARRAPARTDLPDYPHPQQEQNAARLIKQRRSAVALDATTSIPVETFYGMLDRLLPRPGIPPWDVWPWLPQVHCVIFVHRIDGLAPGLYLFERSAGVHLGLRSTMRRDFVFESPAACPPHLRLSLLTPGDFRQQAETLSCQQKIAGAGAFSLGMIAEFGGIETFGPWWYRRLFWEAGLLGQVLYLEAEAAGVRGTGIGCYFDDAVHSVLGIETKEFQSVYHFTVGGPLEDVRLMTRPGYFHLELDSERWLR